MGRSMVFRICLGCKKEEYIRKDGIGKICRSCRAKENSKNRIPKNILGKIFGKLTVLSFSHTSKYAYWNCQCECGNECILAGFRLRNGNTKSCGCLSKSRKGLSTSPTYRSWKAMIQRCYDKNVEHYKRYGAKGITVCERWKNSFEFFLQDMGQRPENCSLDRIDSHNGYEIDNCKWSTPKEQARESRFNITCFGKTQSLIDWEKETGIKWSTIRKRIVELHWDIEKSLTQKVNKYATTQG